MVLLLLRHFVFTYLLRRDTIQGICHSARDVCLHITIMALVSLTAAETWPFIITAVVDACARITARRKRKTSPENMMKEKEKRLYDVIASFPP